MLAHLIIKFTNSSSSSAVKYDVAPGRHPCCTLPNTLSCKVDFGTPYISDARLIDIPNSTAAKALTMLTSSHCEYFEGRVSLEYE